MLVRTSPEINWFDRRNKQSKERKPTFYICLYFQVALSDSSKKWWSSLSFQTFPLQHWVCPTVFAFLKIPENAFLGGKVCQRINFISGNNSRKSMGHLFDNSGCLRRADWKSWPAICTLNLFWRAILSNVKQKWYHMPSVGNKTRSIFNDKNTIILLN